MAPAYREPSGSEIRLTPNLYSVADLMSRIFDIA